MNEPVRTPEAWPTDFRPARAVRDGVDQLDVSSPGAWWLAGLALGMVVLLVVALLDARQVILDQAVRIQVLETEALQHRVTQDQWTCSRLTIKKGVLGKWCIRSEAM